MITVKLPLAVLGFLAIGQFSLRADDPEFATAGFRSNYEKFTHFNCKYRITMAEAKSLNDAETGRWIDAQFCDYIYVKDGKHFRLEHLTQPKPNQNRNGFVPLRMVGDHKQTFDYYAPFGRLTRKPMDPQDYAYSPWSFLQFLTPLELDPLSPWAFVQYAKKTSSEFEVGPLSVGRVDGRDALVVSIRCLSKEACYSTSFEFAPDIGYLPVKTTTDYHNKSTDKVNPRSRTITLLKEFKKCKQGFFPSEVIQYHQYYPIIEDKAQAQFVEIKHYQLLELETDKRPAKKDLSLAIPAGSVVQTLDAVSGGPSFKLQQDELIHPNDFDRINKLLELKEKDPEALIDTRINIPLKYYQRWWFYAICVAGLLVLLAGVRILRSRAKRV